MKRMMFPPAVVVVLALLAGYTNCSSSDLADSALVSSSSTSCSYCSGDQPTNYGQVNIKIGSPDPLVIQKGDIGLNTGGECHTGNFPDNEIKWQLTGVNGGNSTSSTFKHQCIDGRFQFLVQFTAGFDYETPHSLEVQLIVYDEDGSPLEPVTTSINVLAVDPPE